MQSTRKLEVAPKKVAAQQIVAHGSLSSPVTAQPQRNLNKVDKMDKVPLPTSLSKNIERKVDSPPFNLEQTKKIRFL